MFAESAYARRRRWKPGHFSFNTREGQCPTCRGLGHIDLDVQYLPDITVQCPTCHGARFNDATLAVRVDGLTIADVLGLSVDDALERFADRAPVAAALRPVSEVGLGYLRLGEPTPSLSGGESQRLRIASRLRSSQRGALYVFDEPSTGLHPLDVATLVGVFDRLLDAGATIIVIDHDLDLLAAADHLIDMGPGGGPDGGHIVAAGTPEDVARAPDSVTGPWLAEHLSLPQPRLLPNGPWFPPLGPAPAAPMLAALPRPGRRLGPAPRVPDRCFGVRLIGVPGGRDRRARGRDLPDHVVPGRHLVVGGGDTRRVVHPLQVADLPALGERDDHGPRPRPGPCAPSGAGSPCGRSADRTARRGRRRRRGCRGRRRRWRPGPADARRRTRQGPAGAGSGCGHRGWRRR